MERYSRLRRWIKAQALPPDPEQSDGAIRVKAEVGSLLVSASSSCKRTPGFARAKVDQQLRIGSDGHCCEDALHQRIPIADLFFATP